MLYVFDRLRRSFPSCTLRRFQHVMHRSFLSGCRLQGHAVHLLPLNHTHHNVKGMFLLLMFTFLEIFLKQRKTTPESRLQKFHRPSQQKAIDLMPLSDHNLYITEPETHLAAVEAQRINCSLTCIMITTAIELRCSLRRLLRASFLDGILEIPAFGKSDKTREKKEKNVGAFTSSLNFDAKNRAFRSHFSSLCWSWCC